MNINEVYKLMDHFEKSSLSELELELEGAQLSMKKGTGSQAAAPVHHVTEQTVQVVQAESTETGKEAAGKDAAEGEILIKAPLVGTFYRSASPTEKPFVMIGDKVKKGDVVGIIEAMKLMNDITAPEDGVIDKIEVDNESMVEFGQVLIRMKES